MPKKKDKVKVEDPKNYTPIGKEYFEKASKQNNEVVGVKELSETMHKDYMSTLIDTALQGKKKYDDIFYVVVITKREKLIRTAIRNYFMSRQSCPTPNYDQTVYKFNPKDENLEFLWVVPSKDMCKTMYYNRYNLELKNDPLLPYVVDYVEGKLYNTAVVLNKENIIK